MICFCPVTSVKNDGIFDGIRDNTIMTAMGEYHHVDRYRRQERETKEKRLQTI